jgi:hypothetical protein
MCQTFRWNHLIRWCLPPFNISGVLLRCHICPPCPIVMVWKLGEGKFDFKFEKSSWGENIGGMGGLKGTFAKWRVEGAPLIRTLVIAYLKDFWYILKIFHLLVVESHKKVHLIQKYVTLYSYVNMCFKNLSKIIHFQVF